MCLSSSLSVRKTLLQYGQGDGPLLPLPLATSHLQGAGVDAVLLVPVVPELGVVVLAEADV